MLWVVLLIGLAVFLWVQRPAWRGQGGGPRSFAALGLFALAVMALRSGQIVMALVLGALGLMLGLFWGKAISGAKGGNRPGREGPASPKGSAPMTRSEAYGVLGLALGASPEDIKQAHRRLMKHVHPDRGGSDDLAARINLAKDLLLGRG